MRLQHSPLPCVQVDAHARQGQTSSAPDRIHHEPTDHYHVDRWTQHWERSVSLQVTGGIRICHLIEAAAKIRAS
jgi:hypothetical protein